MDPEVAEVPVKPVELECKIFFQAVV
jgi:hypothetical protein